MTMRAIDKWVYVGLAKGAGETFVHIQWDGKRLSLSGVEGPLPNGNCKGSCGQIDLHNIYNPAPDVAIIKLTQVWAAWHLNDMRAGCEHQRAEQWDKRPIDPSKPLNAYGKHFPGQRQDSWNMLTWVSRREHPQGLLSEPCPTCGYKFGTAWLHEEVPEEVITFLHSLPSVDAPKGWR